MRILSSNATIRSMWSSKPRCPCTTQYSSYERTLEWNLLTFQDFNRRLVILLAYPPTNAIKSASKPKTQSVHKTNRFSDSFLILYMTWSDQMTHIVMCFDYDILTAELGWQKSSLLHLDDTTQATSNEMMQIMLLTTPMDQLMHHHEHSNFPRLTYHPMMSWQTREDANFHLIVPETHLLPDICPTRQAINTTQAHGT